MDPVAAVGQPAPAFELEDLTGKLYRLGETDDVLVLDFWSADCPWSERSDSHIQALLANEPWADQVHIWRIASNVNEGMEALRQAANDRAVSPVLRDEDHKVADMYGAKTTPHFFVIGPDQILHYMGAPDDSTWRNPEPTRDYLRTAIAAALRGESPDPAQTPGRGCTIVRHRARADGGASAE